MQGNVIISFEDIKVPRIKTQKEQEDLIREIEAVFLRDGLFDWEKYKRVKFHIENQIIDISWKKENTLGIHFASLMFFVGAIFGICTSLAKTPGTIFFLVLAAILILCQSVITGRKNVKKYSQELLAYQTVDGILKYLADKYKWNNKSKRATLSTL